MKVIPVTTFFTFLLLNFSPLARNGMDHKKHDHSNKKAISKKLASDKIVVKVKGMVCAFCAQGIEKNFNKLKSVKETKVDLDSMEVTVKLKPNAKLSKDEIRQVVTGAGFSYVGTKNASP